MDYSSFLFSNILSFIYFIWSQNIDSIDVESYILEIKNGTTSNIFKSLYT